MAWVSAVALLAVFEYMVFGGMVGYARGKFKVEAPATTGHEIFDRYFRVQQNTLEQLVIFLPALFVFANYTHTLTAAIVGGVFILGRALYAIGYIRAPGSRGFGFLLTFLANIVLLFGGIYGAIRTAVAAT